MEEEIQKLMIKMMADRLTTDYHSKDWVIEFYRETAIDILKQNRRNNIMRVMISMPMKGDTNAVIKLRMDKIKDQFKKLHIDVADTIFTEEVDGYIHPALYYISKSIHAMANCDAIYFARGWQQAPGCCIERKIAEQYGVKILPDDFLEEPVHENIKWYADNTEIRTWPNELKEQYGISILNCADNEKHIPHTD